MTKKSLLDYSSLTRTFGKVPSFEWAGVQASATWTTSSAWQTQPLSCSRAVVAPAATGIRATRGTGRVKRAPFFPRFRRTAFCVDRGPFAALTVREASRIRVLVHAFLFVLTPDTVGLCAILTGSVLHAGTAARIYGQSLCLDRPVENGYLLQIILY